MHLVTGNGSKKDGVAFNDFDFGNFLWGHAGKQLGFSISTLRIGAQANNMFNGESNNPGQDVGLLDSKADQRAISQGFFYPNYPPKNILGLK